MYSLCVCLFLFVSLVKAAEPFYEDESLVMEGSPVSLKCCSIIRNQEKYSFDFQVRSSENISETLPVVQLHFDRGEVRVAHTPMDDAVLNDALFILQVKAASNEFPLSWDTFIYKSTTKRHKAILEKLGFKSKTSTSVKQDRYVWYWSHPGMIAQTPPLTSVPHSTPEPLRPGVSTNEIPPFALPESCYS